MTIAGSDISAVNDVTLVAGNNIDIKASQGSFGSQSNDSHQSVGAGINFGSDGIGFTGNMAMGEGELDREGTTHTNSHITAGKNLTVTSGNNTSIVGGNLSGTDISMDVGGDLTLASVQDKGKVEGERWDVAANLTVGAGVSGGASVGKGETQGSSAWVNEQSSIIGSSSVTIRTEGHTQIDGAVIANQDAEGNDLGNLSLDTGTLGFSDIKDHDKEDSYYLNVGFNAGDNTGTNQPESGNTYTASGSLSSHDKEQINRATVGDGTITVRDNSEQDLSGLNRDTTVAQEVTKDESSSTELYASSTSVESVGNLISNPGTQLEQWQTNVTNVASKDAWQEVISNGSTVLERSVLLAKTLGTNLDGSLAQQVGEAGETAIEVAMVQHGMSAEEANAYLQENPEVVNVIAQLNMVRKAMENPDGFKAEQLAEQVAQIGATTMQQLSNNRADEQGVLYYDVNGVKTKLTPLQAATVAVGNAQRYLDELAATNPTALMAAEVMIAGATGGPVKKALMIALNKGVEAAVGEHVASVMDKVNNHVGHVISAVNENADEFALEAADENFTTQGLLKDGARFVTETLGGIDVPGKKGGSASVSVGAKLPEGTGSKSVVDYKELSAGCSGSWCKPLNKPEPNTTYKVDDNYSFTTDERGRTQKVEGQLNLDTADRNKYQQCKAGKCGDAGDEGGHLIASIFNGPGEAINLVPMNGNLNKGAWKIMENDWAAALEQGKSVKVTIEPEYIGGSKRPVSFNIAYQIGNDPLIEKTFKNTPRGE